jgi:hypothetical protein
VQTSPHGSSTCLAHSRKKNFHLAAAHQSRELRNFHGSSTVITVTKPQRIQRTGHIGTYKNIARKLLRKSQDREELTLRFVLEKWWPGWRSQYSDSLRAGRFGVQTPVGAGFSPPVRTAPGAHLASCTMSTGDLSQW